MTGRSRNGLITKLLCWTGLWGAIFAVQLASLQGPDADVPPVTGDVAEVFNIGWELAHGRGYRFDWDDAACRQLWARRDLDGQFRIFTNRRGSHATLFRPPLMPIALAAMLLFHPSEPFFTWKMIDAALFSAAAVLLVHGVKHRFGWRAALALLPLLLLDPLRIDFVPGLWTEGLAFDGMAVLSWFLLTNRINSSGWAIAAGITIGLLCLDRSTFTLLVPLLCGVLVFNTGTDRRRRIKLGLICLGSAVLLQVPWWTRNIIVSHRFIPLATQGGFSLPDEYSDEAVRMRGLWTAREMTRLWADTATTPAERARRASPEVLSLWPGSPDWAALIHAVDCESLQTELAVADVGQHAAVAWVRAHWPQLPRLFFEKLATQTLEHRGWLATLALLGGGTALADQPRRRSAIGLTLLVGIFACGVGLTHVVVGRFLVPVLPPLYALAAGGAGELLRRAPLLR